MKEFFTNVPKVEYEGKKSNNPMAFRYYNPDEVIAVKKMRDHLKFALFYWHIMCGDGTDMFGRGTTDKTFGGATPMHLPYLMGSAHRILTLTPEEHFSVLVELTPETICFAR